MIHCRVPMRLKWLALLLLCCSTESLLAQLPSCTDRVIYFLGSNLYNYHTDLPPSATNPSVNTIVPPNGAAGLAVSRNLNGGNPSPTFYTSLAVNGVLFYHYYDGSTWINTGHQSGSVNHAAGGGFIFSIDVSKGRIWRYDGSGNATVVLNLPLTPGILLPYSVDMAADCGGNFYLLRYADPQVLEKYNANGALLQSWPLSGFTFSGGGGMAISDNTLYFDNGLTVVKGTIGNDTIHCEVINGLNGWYYNNDFASCAAPFSASPSVVAEDTVYYCAGSNGVTIKGDGNGDYTWSVLSGPAVISGTGPSVTVSSPGVSQILVRMSSNDACHAYILDTVTIIPIQAILSAGPDDTLFGCGSFQSTLQGSVTITSNPPYQVYWLPPAAIASGGNTLQPVIRPTATTTFIMEVSSGRCTWRDSVLITTVDARENNAAFDHRWHLGCREDTLLLTNLSNSSFGPLDYSWTFGDLSAPVTMPHPQHVYRSQGVYEVTLITDNGYCRDTLSRMVDSRHPLQAALAVENDVICAGDTVFFDGSASLPQGAELAWHFGDGETGTGTQTQHVYANNGRYTVMLIVTDTLHCSDTAFYGLATGIPHIDIGPPDTTVCDGMPFSLPARDNDPFPHYLWSDGSTAPTLPVHHSGLYYLHATNGCGTATDSIRIELQDCRIWLPNAFSPNSDGRNDVFGIAHYRSVIQQMDLRVFNRYGNQVFRSFQADKGWDGRDSDIGNYYYYLWYRDHAGREYTLKGEVSLLR